ncbi:hypothetical protein CBR_g41052 [Chara braunii]|uniref:Importin-7/11-like TPR repeats domain-containing protein n=1 Tax=Chara braunii TaxID=69332 RepID=A0A388LV07_CHABU|nr:hypothetical protein CBR_g41052 [Chara braunii]|eukprot:GBG86148.1 hypothetical protein CBR_g41052 [Chara braunii]
MHETEGEKDNNLSYGYDYWVSQDSGVEDGAADAEAGEYARRRQVYAADPVNSLGLGPILKAKLQACSTVHGEAAFNSAKGGVASSKAFAKFATMRRDSVGADFRNIRQQLWILSITLAENAGRELLLHGLLEFVSSLFGYVLKSVSGDIAVRARIEWNL